MSVAPKDLVVLAADRHMEATLQGLLSRPKSIPIRPCSFDIHTHPHRDAGCRSEGPRFLSSFSNQYRHALLVFDYEGCGREDRGREALERELEAALAGQGWADRSAVVVIAPELEAWVWSDSPHVEEALGWKSPSPPLREWLTAEGFLEEGRIKPARPKEAFEAALRKARRPVSSSIFKQLASSVGFGRCVDPSFDKLLRTLRAWFAE